MFERNEHIATKDDWRTFPMSDKHTEFILERKFSEEELNNLKCGNVPDEMEDKWFYYVEDDVLYAYRSWTGYCVYIIKLKPDGQHHVVATRDEEVCETKSIEEDKKILNRLLNWWTQPFYDYYAEWLEETREAIQNSLRMPQSEIDSTIEYNPLQNEN